MLLKGEAWLHCEWGTGAPWYFLPFVFSFSSICDWIKSVLSSDTLYLCSSVVCCMVVHLFLMMFSSFIFVCSESCPSYFFIYLSSGFGVRVAFHTLSSDRMAAFKESARNGCIIGHNWRGNYMYESMSWSQRFWWSDVLARSILFRCSEGSRWISDMRRDYVYLYVSYSCFNIKRALGRSFNSMPMCRWHNF